MTVLIACEESQTVCIEFRKRGHDAFSCDIQECSGGHPEWHINGDVLPLLDGNCHFKTQDGNSWVVLNKWDLIIAHPPCTYLAVSGNRWFDIDKYGEKAIERRYARFDAVDFFMSIANADCERIAIENPVGVMSTIWRKPNQIIQPWMFGDPYEKKTCLWLKNLPNLKETDVVTPPPRIHFASGKSMPEWIGKTWGSKDRQKIRSKTFAGIAKAMAEQWR